MHSWDPNALKLTDEFLKQLSFGDKLTTLNVGIYSGYNVPDVKTIVNEIRKKFQVSSQYSDYYVEYKGNVFSVQPEKSRRGNYAQVSYFADKETWNINAEERTNALMKQGKKPIDKIFV